jgi:hypothetical protein
MGKTKEVMSTEKKDQIILSAIVYTALEHLKNNKAIPYKYRRKLGKISKMVREKADYLDWFGDNKEALVHVLALAINGHEIERLDVVIKVIELSPKAKKLYEECKKEAKKRLEKY